MVAWVESIWRFGSRDGVLVVVGVSKPLAAVAVVLVGAEFA